MQLQINKRKYTTTKATQELSDLIEKLESNLEDDITDCISSTTFAGVIPKDNGKSSSDCWYEYWTVNDNFKIKIKNGKIIPIYFADNGSEKTTNYHWCHWQKINFAEVCAALEDAIKIYNNKVAKKEKEIERFLEICSKYLPTPENK
jgi:hypothetical protein